MAIIYDGHKIMIEKNEDSNQSYKTATSDLPDSSNKTYSFYWGEHGTDQIGITNYDKVDGINSFGFLKQESGSYGGTPNISENFWIVLFNNGRVFKRPKRLGCRVRFVRKIE